MKRTALIGLAALLVAGGILVMLSASYFRDPNRGVEVQIVGSAADSEWSKQDWLTDYHLTERSGRDFDSHELDGEVHVVSFFFASCPGPCERQNRQLEAIQSGYAKKGVKFLSITCDPKRDSPTALSAYAKKFQADPKQWLFLTGDMKLLRRVGAEVYGVALDEQTHVESFLVYDRAGALRGKFPWNKPDELAKMRLMLDELLAESRELAESKEAAKSQDGGSPKAVPVDGDNSHSVDEPDDKDKPTAEVESAKEQGS